MCMTGFCNLLIKQIHSKSSKILKIFVIQLPSENSMNPFSRVEQEEALDIFDKAPVISSSLMFIFGTTGISFLGYFGGLPLRLRNASVCI